jgi:hypothetical protein
MTMNSTDHDMSVPACKYSTAVLSTAVGAVSGLGAFSVQGAVLGAIAGAGLGRVLCGTKENPGILSRILAPYVNPKWEAFDVSKADDFVERLGVEDPAARKTLVQAALRAHREGRFTGSEPLPTPPEYQAGVKLLLSHAVTA